MSSKPGAPPPAPKAQEKVQELVDAIRRADASLVSTLIELEGPRLVKGPDPSGVLPLVAAAELGHVGILKMCLDAGADPNQCISTNGNTALRAAILSGDGECISELISRGADVNLETSRGTPLITAATEGDCSSLTLLLDHGAEVNHEIKDGNTALMAAVREDRREAVKLLLKRGARPDRVSERSGMSAVNLAQDKMLPEVYSLLMQSSVTSAAEQALSQSDERMRQAQHQLEVEAGEARRELEAESVERRAEVARKVSAIQAESEELLQRMGLARKPGKAT